MRGTLVPWLAAAAPVALGAMLLNEETTCSSWCSVSSCDVVVFSSEKGYIFVDVNFKRDKGDYIFIKFDIHSLQYQLDQHCRDRGAEPLIQQSGVHALSKDYLLALSSLA